jgi:membrane fusion protein (multidrug efflux system)
MRVAICAMAVLCGFVLSSRAQQTAPLVGTIVAERKPIAKTADFVGRVDAVERVEIRARITGYLEELLFAEGDPINEGAPLYRIEKGLFQAAVEQAEGALDRSKAAKVLAEVQLQRAEELLAKSSGTAVARDQALAADQSAKGSILVDQANLDTARIKLGYTDIVAPVSGKVGRTTLTKGNVVTPQSPPLTVIVSQDPMYVTFPVSQRELMRARRRQAAASTSRASRLSSALPTTRCTSIPVGLISST